LDVEVNDVFNSPALSWQIFDWNSIYD